jgi:Domain of unknown function (DUF397)
MGTVATAWRKSTYSGGNGGECVEVAPADGVMVRDTADRKGTTLSFSAPAWQEFLSRVG